MNTQDQAFDADVPINWELLLGHTEISNTMRTEGNKVIATWTRKQIAHDGTVIRVEEDDYVMFEWPEVKKSLFDKIVDFFV